MACFFQVQQEFDAVTPITTYEHISVGGSTILATTVPTLASDRDATMAAQRRILWAPQGGSVVALRQDTNAQSGSRLMPYAIDETGLRWFSYHKRVLFNSQTQYYDFFVGPPFLNPTTIVATFSYGSSSLFSFVTAAVSPNGVRGCYIMSLRQASSNSFQVRGFELSGTTWRSFPIDTMSTGRSVLIAASIIISNTGHISITAQTSSETWWYYFAQHRQVTGNRHLVWHSNARVPLWHVFRPPEILYGGVARDASQQPYLYVPQARILFPAPLPRLPYISAPANVSGGFALVVASGPQASTLVRQEGCESFLSEVVLGLAPTNNGFALGREISAGQNFRVQRGITLGRGLRVRRNFRKKRQ